MWQTETLQFLVAVALDILLGDPHGWPHVTRMTGWLASLFEPLFARALGRTIVSGGLFWIGVCLSALGGYFLIRSLLDALGRPLAWIFDAVVIYQTIAARDLDRHARNVHTPLIFNEIETARKAVSYLVGRDTQSLDAQGISRATVEAVSESTTDGVIAPLFWAALGGAPAALLYRTVNTLDSLVGHRTDEYELMGKVSAIADDLMGFLPARLCALASVVPRGFKNVTEIVRDSGRHASPNAGWSEAAAAWALNVRLGGTNYYDGIPFNGPVFNPKAPEAMPQDIPRVLRWFWSVSLFCILILTTGLYVRERREREAAPKAPNTEPYTPKAEYDPILKRNFVPQSAPPPVKLPGKITRPNNDGNRPTP